jgi:hypothetical protein
MLRETAGEGALTFEVGHSFAPEDALRIHAEIERAAPGTPVEIDFRRVRECQDFALALLAQDMVSGRARVAVRGMSKHQQRLLGYFGVPEDVPAGPEGPEVV